MTSWDKYVPLERLRTTTIRAAGKIMVRALANA